jgi:hypothetical protein
MDGIGRYDGDVQMFVQEPRSPDRRRLRFLRWLVEHDRYDHPASGPASGEFADTLVADISPSTAPQPVDPQPMDAQP